MLNFAIDYKDAINKITEDRTMQLRKYELTKEEWDIAGQLCDVIKVYVFYDATQFFSRKRPSLAAVIPAMDRIDEYLATASVDKTYLPSIRAAASLGKKTINRYYDLSDRSESYRIAMALNPRYKLNYFKQAKWPSDWVDLAKEITPEEFNRNYAHRKFGPDVDDEVEIVNGPGTGTAKEKDKVRVQLHIPVNNVN
ncbi:hypothetical protein BC629DRAFT_1299019 [Irpex lacteus]|nr:hypothetical protein BC629DRAFT_1299019 [Irpex lacteus]